MDNEQDVVQRAGAAAGLLRPDECFALQLTTQQRFDFLLKQLQDQRQFIHNIEGRGYTVTAAVATALIVLPALAVDRGLLCSPPMLSAQVILLTVIALISSWFLAKDRSHLQWLRRSIIRTMQVLGAYRE